MPPRVLTTAREAAEVREATRGAGRRLALVPTMGFLHDGHASLMAAARAAADVVAVTIFVNPTQFGPSEDLSRYPRDFASDMARCAKAGVDVVFHPEATEVYPKGHQTFVEVVELSRGLCGERRPGHFRGVATVVAQLFALFRPHVALFGEKDYQQLQVVRRLSTDLHLGVEVRAMPIVREADGLAMSSRNAYLSAAERPRARALNLGLEAARARFRRGVYQPEVLLAAVREALRAADVREDYIALVDPDTLEPLAVAVPGARLLVAGFVGATRLIDNVELG
ncbi:MAG: pantoate--beta-alanine ligase [Myxococcaceae bacterium]